MNVERYRDVCFLSLECVRRGEPSSQLSSPGYTAGQQVDRQIDFNKYFDGENLVQEDM